MNFVLPCSPGCRLSFSSRLAAAQPRPIRSASHAGRSLRAAAAQQPSRRSTGTQPTSRDDDGRRRADRRCRAQAARIGDRRYPAGEHARCSRRAGHRRDQHQRAARCARAADRQRPGPRRRTPGAAAQWTADLELPRASRHSDRSNPAGRDPARGGRAEIRLSRRSEGREHRPSPALPLDGGAGRRAALRPTAAMPTAMATSLG